MYSSVRLVTEIFCNFLIKREGVFASCLLHLVIETEKTSICGVFDSFERMFCNLNCIYNTTRNNKLINKK
jgi:hypothetical protein